VKITPLELRKPDFKRTFKGFSPDEVQAILSSAADALEELIRENKELKEKGSALQEKVKSYQDMENTLNETMILAQKTGDSARQTARREAELITARAEVEVEKMMEQARARVMELKLEVEELQHQKQAYLLRLRSLVASQWKMLQEEKEEDEKMRDIITSGAEELDTGEKIEALTEEETEGALGRIPREQIENAAAEEEEQVPAGDVEVEEEQPEDKPEEEAMQPEEVSEELGEMLKGTSPEDKKKDKGGKSGGAQAAQEEETDSEEPDQTSEEDIEERDDPQLLWEEEPYGQEPEEQEDSPSPDK